MASEAAEQAADAVLQDSLIRANLLLKDAPGDEVLQLLERADKQLKKRLVGVTVGPNMAFSDAQLATYSKQIDATIRYVKKRLLGITHNKAKFAISHSVKATAKEIAQLEEAFSGVATPLKLRQAATMDGIVQGTEGAMIPQRATSVDRYGDHMTRQFRTIMRDGMLQGASQGQMVDALVGHGGPKGPKVSTSARVDPATGKVIRLREENIPEGLFKRKKYWAERVVRTEVAHSQNEARLRTIDTAKETDFPDMAKKILAMMDMRTAMDSIGVHGQVKGTDEMFQDGAGRQYLRPPARPNDRETIVPWRKSWDETPYSSPMPPKDVATLQAGNQLPGPAKQLQIQNATKSFEAQLDKKSKAAMANVHRMIGTAMAAKIAPAIAAQNVTAFKAAQATAKAQAKAGAAAAKAAEAKMVANATAKAQSAVTAAAKAKANVVLKMKEAKAKALAYQKKLAAEAKAKLVKAAKEQQAFFKDVAKKKAKKGLSPDTVLGPIEDLAKSDPVLFGELYNQVVKGGAGLSPKFFQGLGAYYKVNSKAIAKGMGIWKPAPPKPKWAKAYPEPKTDFDISGFTYKLEGGKWNDIFQGTQKQGFVLKVGDEWVADPPEYLKAKGWEKLTWPANQKNLPQATDYSLALSKEIKATKAEAQKAAKIAKIAADVKAQAAAQTAQLKAQTAQLKAKKIEAMEAGKFSPRKVPNTKLAPLKVDAATKKAVQDAKKWAKTADLSNVGEGGQSYGGKVVDSYIKAAGDAELEKVHGKWSNGWYGSSQGARNQVGVILKGKHTPEMLKEIARDIGYGGPVEKIPEWVRRKYAATQAVLESRDSKGGNQREWMFLSRGIGGDQGKRLRTSRAKGGKRKVALRSVSSWSSKREAAEGFASGGVVVRAAVHRSRVFSQFEQEEVAWDRFGESESEYIVISPDLGEKFDARDLEDRKNPDDYGGYSWDTKALATDKSSPEYMQWLEKQ